MAQGPAQQFRHWLESQPRGAGEVPFENLLRVWGVDNPTPQERVRIQQDLADAGISAQPGLDRLERYSNTTLWLHRPVVAPTPQAAEPAATGYTAAHTGTVPRAHPIGLALITVGALIGVISLFFEWVSGDTLWELYTVLDVITVLLGLATIALCIGNLLAPRMAFLRAALVPLAMFFALPALVTAVEFVVDPGPLELGTVAGLLGALLASAGLVVLVLSDLLASRRGREVGLATALIGLGAACFVALFVTVAQLLPTVEVGLGEAVSEWEFAKVTDWVDQLAVLALLGVAVAAVVARRVPALTLALGVLLSYFALPDFLIAIDDIANGGTLFAADVMGFFSGLVATGVSVLLIATALPADE